MAGTPFFWGAGGQKLTPAQVQSLRAVAEARGTRPVAQNFGEGLAALGDALVVNAYNGRANTAESEGQKLVADAIAGKDWMGALSNEWASPGQRAAAGAMMDRGWQLEDRNAQWAREDARAAASAQQPEWGYETLPNGDIIAFNKKDPTAGYQTFYDGPEPIPDPFTLGENDTRFAGDGTIIAKGLPKTPDTVINNNMGASDEFYKKLDANAGEQQAALIDAGRNAASNNIRLQQIQELLKTAPQGAAGGITQLAGSLGIPVEGLDDLQAAQALINQMVPGQRPPGSGTMSDADLALFKASLPSIINQPGGNRKILETAQAINTYTIAQAAIAEKVANREITPAEGRAQQAALPNPLATPPGGASGGAPEGVDPAVWAVMTPQEKALWD